MAVAGNPISPNPEPFPSSWGPAATSTNPVTTVMLLELTLELPVSVAIGVVDFSTGWSALLLIPAGGVDGFSKVNTGAVLALATKADWPCEMTRLPPALVKLTL